MIAQAGVSSWASAQNATFHGLGDLPGGTFSSWAEAVSADGTTVVGSSYSGFSGSDPIFEAYRWTQASGMVALGSLSPPFTSSFGRGVSADGTTIIGLRNVSNTWQGFVWTVPAGVVPLTDPAFDHLNPLGISSDGSVIVGFGSRVDTVLVGFRWTQAEGVVDLGGLPNDHGQPDSGATGVSADGSVVTGESLTFESAVEPILWTAAGGMVGLGDVPGGTHYAIAWAISADGSTVGGGARTSDLFGRDEAFIWNQTDGFVRLDPLGGAAFGSTVTAISADGTIVVGGTDAFGAMIWDAQHGMRSVRDVLVNEHGLDLAGWTLRSAADVSADGTVIVGGGTNPNGDFEAWVARIPPPAIPAVSCWGLLVMTLGLATAATSILRRHGRANPRPS